MKIRVPATTTNFGPGFDTFGLALDLHNTFEFHPSEDYEIRIEGFGRGIPADRENLVVKVYRRSCKVFGLEEVPFILKQVNRIPPARGLGSSATAIVGGIEICCALHGKEIPLKEKLGVAFEFEPHPDNLVPAFVGGFVVCVGRTTYQKLPFPEELSLVFVVPDFEIPTETARSVIRKSVPLEDAVFNIQRSSLFVSAILTRRFELLRVAVEDRIHQPYRSKLVRGFERVLEEGYRAGAYGVFLSGSGPTVCAITDEEVKEYVGNSMKTALEKEGVNAEVLYLKAVDEGVLLE